MWSHITIICLVGSAPLLSAKTPAVDLSFDTSSGTCGASHTGFFFRLSMSCLAPNPSSQFFRNHASSPSIPLSSCSTMFIAPWQADIPEMFFLIRLNRLKIPNGSRLRIVSVDRAGKPTDKPAADIFYGDLTSFIERHGSPYIRTGSSVKISWESTNPVVDITTPCVPYSLDFGLTAVAFWPRWQNSTSGLLECPLNSFLCRPINYCLPNRFVADNVKHCIDGDDELGIFHVDTPSPFEDMDHPPSHPFPGPSMPSRLGAFSSAVFVPLIVFVIAGVLLVSCLVRSRSICRQFSSLRRQSFSSTLRQLFCGIDRSSIRMSVQPGTTAAMPPTMGRALHSEGLSGNLRASAFSYTSSVASVNVVSKELDMSPPSYEEALKLPMASTTFVGEWFSRNVTQRSETIESVAEITATSPIDEEEPENTDDREKNGNDKEPSENSDTSEQNEQTTTTSHIEWV